MLALLRSIVPVLVMLSKFVDVKKLIALFSAITPLPAKAADVKDWLGKLLLNVFQPGPFYAYLVLTLEPIVIKWLGLDKAVGDGPSPLFIVSSCLKDIPPDSLDLRDAVENEIRQHLADTCHPDTVAADWTKIGDLIELVLKVISLLREMFVTPEPPTPTPSPSPIG